MAKKRKKKVKPKRKPARRAARGGLEFNHAMIYSFDVARAVAFYRNVLGFRMVDEYPGAYARLQSPTGNTTLALHALDPGQRMDPTREGVRLYFEVKKLVSFCKRLEGQGVQLDEPPKLMPWGWQHAYLRDPDGHQLSLYWAGPKRLRKTVMRAHGRV